MVSHNKKKRTILREPTELPLPVFVASRAEQIVEQSAELSIAVVLCRTWQGPFSQHDSAEQIEAISSQFNHKK